MLVTTVRHTTGTMSVTGVTCVTSETGMTSETSFSPAQSGACWWSPVTASPEP